MEKMNTVLITQSVEFINSINTVLKNFDTIVIGAIYSSMDQVLNLEKEKHFELVIWDVSEENLSTIEKENVRCEKFRVIMISSNPKDAIEAFNLEAVDFILKPELADRFPSSLNKVINLTTVNNTLDTLSESLFEDHGPIKIIPVASLNDIAIIPVDTITYLESQGRYTLIYTQDGKSVVSSKNLGVYEKLLSQNNFFRIHHSYIVNIDKSVKIQKKDGVYLEIINNKYLPVSKRRVEGFYRCLGIIS
jgi:two-component system LytT family response regulator